MGHDEATKDTEPVADKPDNDKSSDERARKERVLHTRIPASLEEEIKRLADALAIPVSNLVRNILQDTVGLVGTVADHVEGVVSGLRDDARNLSSHVVADRDNLRRAGPPTRPGRRGPSATRRPPRPPLRVLRPARSGSPPRTPT